MSKNLSSVCLSCGICCSGALFNNAVLKHGEDKLLGNDASIFTDDEGTTRLRLGCPRFSEVEGCTIYSQKRPSICGEFECTLLAGVKLGKMSVEEGVSIAGELHEMMGALQQKCKELMPQVEWPYELVGHGALARLMEEAKGKGARLSTYDMQRIFCQRGAIVMYVRQYFSAAFMQQFIQEELWQGEKWMEGSEKARSKYLAPFATS